LRIITIREGGLLVGAAPMVRRRERGIERLEFIGMRTLHEPSGFLHRDGASLTALLQATLALKRPLALQRVDAGSPVERILRAGVGRGGWVIGRDAAPTVSVPIAGTWAGYLASLSGKLRWQQKRARTLAEALGPVTIEKVAPSASEVGALFDTFAALEASGWKGERRSALLTKEPLGHFFRAYAHAAAGNSALRVWFLRIGTRVAAAQLTVEAHHAVWVLKIAYDESLAQVSPGFQLTFRALEDAFVAGVSAYEFLGSADDWKLRWRGRLRAHRLVLAYPRSTRGVLGLSVDVGVHAMRAAARRLRWRPS
jgi:CelD/BcsL family acetyltransferase involved in cellulose biosynthesis